jgi:hypothetical protein
LDKAVKNIFVGIGFILVAISLAFIPMGRAWWFWMFIPAFATLGGGVAEYLRLKQSEQRSLPATPGPPAVGPAPQRAAGLPRRNTAELVMPPPSVTENTTRHLGSEAPTRHIGRAVENPSSESQPDS